MPDDIKPPVPQDIAVPARSIALVIQALEDGDFDRRIATEFRDAVGELEDRSQMMGGNPMKGTLTITIEVKAHQGVIELQGSHKLKTPPLPKKRTIMWRGRDGMLVRNNPQQMEMFGAPREVRDATTTAVVRDAAYGG